MVEALLRLGETEHVESLRPVLERPLKLVPEMLAVTLVQTSPTWGSLKDELLGVLLPAGHALAFLKMLPLFCGAAVYAFGAYHTFQRNTNQIHAVVRLQLGFAGCLVLGC